MHLRRPLPPLFLVAALCLGAVHAPAAGQQPPTLHTVTSDGHPMAVWEKRPAAPRAAVVLVHGRTWSTLPDFDLQVPGEDLSLMDGLVELGYAAYGLDLRGYGATPRDETGWLTPDRAVEDLATVLRWIREREGGHPVHLLGWSLGSVVSQLTAQRHPDLVDRLVLFGYPFRPGGKPAVDEPSGEPLRRPTTAEAATSDFITPGSISPEAVAAYVAAALVADPVRVDWTRGHQWGALDPAEVRVPTLVLHGERDPLAPFASQAALFQGLGTADRAWVVIPGGDHAAFLESPGPTSWRWWTRSSGAGTPRPDASRSAPCRCARPRRTRLLRPRGEPAGCTRMPSLRNGGSPRPGR